MALFDTLVLSRFHGREHCRWIFGTDDAKSILMQEYGFENRKKNNNNSALINSGFHGCIGRNKSDDFLLLSYCQTDSSIFGHSFIIFRLVVIEAFGFEQRDKLFYSTFSSYELSLLRGMEENESFFGVVLHGNSACASQPEAGSESHG